MTDVILDPERWESVEAGDDALLERWLVAEGDHVLAGQVLAQARLIHQPVDVTAPHAGVVEEIVVGGGQTFALGALLARVIDF